MTATTKAIVIIFLSMRVRTELDVLKRGVGEDKYQAPFVDITRLCI